MSEPTVADWRTRDRRATCQWCGAELARRPRGRPRKYCSPACRQRAYEQRRHLAAGSHAIPDDAVVITPQRAAQLRDGLFELRCAAEDVATAADEGAVGAELSQLCAEVVDLARKLEKLR